MAALTEDEERGLTRFHNRQCPVPSRVPDDQKGFEISALRGSVVKNSGGGCNSGNSDWKSEIGVPFSKMSAEERLRMNIFGPGKDRRLATVNNSGHENGWHAWRGDSVWGGNHNAPPSRCEINYQSSRRAYDAGAGIPRMPTPEAWNTITSDSNGKPLGCLAVSVSMDRFDGGTISGVVRLECVGPGFSFFSFSGRVYFSFHCVCCTRVYLLI